MLYKPIESRNSQAFLLGLSDAALNMMFMFAATMIILMNPLAQKQAVEDPIPPPGEVMVEMYWTEIDPNTKKPIDTDMDLHVKCGDDPPVGWSNKGAKRCNYLRDDLGTTYDPQDQVNYEMTASRGLISGKYCVNGHLYSNRWGKYPIKVQFTVKINKGVAGSSAVGKGDTKKVLDKTLEFTDVGQEKNAFCFFIDEKGEYDEKKTFQSDAVCLYSPVQQNTGACAGTATNPY